MFTGPGYLGRMQKLAFILLFLGVALGALMPSKFGSEISSGGEARTLVVAQPDRSLLQQAVDLGTGEIRLLRHDDGHFYADAQVNGAAVRFMVDTGATSIALTHEDARRASIPLEATSEVVGMGAGGEIYGQAVTLDRIRLGPQEVRDMHATVLDGGEQSLLGQTFLARFKSVVIEGDAMVLR